MYYRDTREIRKARDKEMGRVGKIWAACGITWLIIHVLAADKPILGTLTYWGIYVGAVIATVLLVRAMLRINRSAEQQIKELKERGGF